MGVKEDVVFKSASSSSESSSGSGSKSPSESGSGGKSESGDSSSEDGKDGVKKKRTQVKMAFQKEICKSKDLPKQYEELEELLKRESGERWKTPVDVAAAGTGTGATTPGTANPGNPGAGTKIGTTPKTNPGPPQSSDFPNSQILPSLYMTELRLKKERYHPLQPYEKVKTCLNRDMKDIMAEFGE
jgi:hypothetical protein